MLRYLCVCAILGFLLSQSPASAKESFRRPADLLPDGKEVRNAASIDFAAILPTANACWVLASVDHAADSGRFVVRSFAIDGATGKTIKTKGQDFIQLKGTVHILGTLTGKVASKDYPFDWQIPHNMFEMPRIIKESLRSRLSGFRGIVLFPLPADWETPQELPFHSIPAEAASRS